MLECLSKEQFHNLMIYLKMETNPKLMRYDSFLKLGLNDPKEIKTSNVALGYDSSTREVFLFDFLEHEPYRVSFSPTEEQIKIILDDIKIYACNYALEEAYKKFERRMIMSEINDAINKDSLLNYRRY